MKNSIPSVYETDKADLSKIRQAGREQELVALAKLGDLSALSELFLLHYALLFRKAYQITGNQEDAEDAMQSAQMSVFLHIRSFDGRSMFRTWMMRIVMNAALGILRKRATLRETPIDADWNNEEGLSNLPIVDNSPCPIALYEYRELAERLASGARRLRPPLRKVFDLYLKDELSIKEIAERLDITVAAAKSRLSRARNRLRSHLELGSSFDLSM